MIGGGLRAWRSCASASLATRVDLAPTARMAWMSWVVVLFCAGFAAQPSAAQPLRLSDDRGKTVELAAPALRIVTLLPSLAEVVCELDACARLVGTDRHANWPVSVRTLPKLGGLEDTQIERVLALKPDLVLAARSARALERLESLGLPVLALEPKSLADTARVVRTVAAALGQAAAGEALVARLESRLAAAAARIPVAVRGQAVYFEVASTPHAAGEASFIGELLGRLGLANVVPAALGPFPQLSPEFVLRARPAWIMASRQAVDEMPRRPGWAGLAALGDGRVCGFGLEDWDALVRPGPRLADGAEAIVRCLDARASRLPARGAPRASASGAAPAAPGAIERR